MVINELEHGPSKNIEMWGKESQEVTYCRFSDLNI